MAPLFLAALLGAAVAPAAAAAQPPIPTPEGFVNDRAGVMGDWAPKTEALCREIERRTTAEVAVLTVRTTKPVTAQDHAHSVFAAWKVGKKGKDNGVLILVATDDRRIWIATGYGVEGILPDGKVGEIRDLVIVPRFREGSYGEGIYRGVEAIGTVLAGGPVQAAPSGPPEGLRGQPRFNIVVVLLVGALLALFLLAAFGWTVVAGVREGLHHARRERRRGGSALWAAFWAGFVLVYERLLRKQAEHRRWERLRDYHYWGGGGFGGGGFGGGGFGGFGGGGFGGGGAGGGW